MAIFPVERRQRRPECLRGAPRLQGKHILSWEYVATIGLSSETVKRLAAECGFELAGVTAAEPAHPESQAFLDWAAAGKAGAMIYLSDHRSLVRRDPRRLLEGARSIICVGKLYHAPEPLSTAFSDAERAWISRYAWGDDYHIEMRAGLENLAAQLRPAAGRDFRYRVLVDTAPLLERAYAHRAGLGWIGRNTCLINEPLGSWFFLGELLVDLDLPPDSAPPDRCGSCMACVEACPTGALQPTSGSRPGGYELDARLCIAYFTIELRGSIPEGARAGIGPHVFGCDICQDVCPWNRRAPSTSDPAFAPRDGLLVAPPLDRLAGVTEGEFREMFRNSAVSRARYRGFLRNVAVAMGNAGLPRFRPPLERLASCGDPVVEEHARWALARLSSETGQTPGAGRRADAARLGASATRLPTEHG
jgi:epoxyqueuosine reductase